MRGVWEQLDLCSASLAAPQWKQVGRTPGENYELGPYSGVFATQINVKIRYTTKEMIIYVLGVNL